MRFSAKTAAFSSILAVLVWLGWLSAALYYGAANPFDSTEDGTKFLARLGTFGDSFGVVASLMASLAAMGAFYAFAEQREDNKLQQFERNFYSLFDHFQEIVRQIDIKFLAWDDESLIPFDPQGVFATNKAEVQGRDAIRALLASLRESLSVESYDNSKEVAKAYDRFFDQWMDDLGHYFRTLYHIFKLISTECPGDKKLYATIVRAHLSNSEQCLIAYNCICGEGRFEFVKFLKEFSILHNLHRRNLSEQIRAELGFFTSILHPDCFRFSEIKPFDYNDANRQQFWGQNT